MPLAILMSPRWGFSPTTTRGDAPGYINVAPLGLFAGATPLASQAPSVSIIKAWGNAQASALTRFDARDILWLFRLPDLGAIKVSNSVINCPQLRLISYTVCRKAEFLYLTRIFQVTKLFFLTIL